MKHLKLYNIEFIEVLKAFNKRLSDQGRSQSSVESLTNRVKEFFYFLEETGTDSTNKITQKVINSYHAYLEQRPHEQTGGALSGKYIEKHGEAVLRLMEMLTNRKKGLSAFTFPFRFEEPNEIEILTEDEIQQVYACIDNTRLGISNRLIISLLYGCGLRVGELATLEIQDIDIVKSEIRLSNTKTKYERDVPMSPLVVKYLEEYLYYGRNLLIPKVEYETCLLLSLKGKSMSTQAIGKRVKHMMAEAGITKNIHPHSLRHSLGTHLLGDLTLEEIAQVLGHRNLISTQKYTHLKETIVQ